MAASVPETAPRGRRRSLRSGSVMPSERAGSLPRMSARDRILGTQRGYAAFLRLIRADRFLRTVARDALCVGPGQRLLDLGCGNGALSEHVPGVDYTGIDHNASYVASAVKRFGSPSRRFIAADLDSLAVTEGGSFDVVCAVGVLHHLDDGLAVDVLRTSLNLLAEGGRFVSVDPVFDPEQRSFARVLMAMDRGKYVRHPEHYRALASAAAPQVTETDETRFDLNPFPYTHFIMELKLDSAPPIEE